MSTEITLTPGDTAELVCYTCSNLEDMTESQLIDLPRLSTSLANWVLGACASKWCERYANGQTDADYAELVGFSRAKVQACRKVFEERFDLFESFPSLSWSCFRASLAWDDAEKCLEWAHENEASLGEMRAWRRAVHGEDLSKQAELEDDWAEGASEVTTQILAGGDETESECHASEDGTDSSQPVEAIPAEDPVRVDTSPQVDVQAATTEGTSQQPVTAPSAQKTEPAKKRLRWDRKERVKVIANTTDVEVLTNYGRHVVIRGCGSQVEAIRDAIEGCRE